MESLVQFEYLGAGGDIAVAGVLQLLLFNGVGGCAVRAGFFSGLPLVLLPYTRSLL